MSNDHICFVESETDNTYKQRLREAQLAKIDKLFSLMKSEFEIDLHKFDNM